MKTLNQVEPRIPITSLPATISQPGSYYLASNMTCYALGSNGITITSSEVTLDLCGFTLTGSGATGGHGIYASAINVHVRNGIVSTWNGYDKYGVYLNGMASSIRNVTIRNCANGAFMAMNSASVEDCFIHGISNTGACYGIKTSHGAVVRNSKVHSLTGGNPTYGIYVEEDCLITGCNVWDIENPVQSGAAVRIYKGGRITGCVINYSEVNGVQVTDRCVVENNTINDNNRWGAHAAGIYIVGDYNRIQNNQIAQNYYGLSFAAGSKTNFVFGNTILQNTTNIIGTLAGNHIGPLDSAIGTPTNHPWANFIF